MPLDRSPESPEFRAIPGRIMGIPSNFRGATEPLDFTPRYSYRLARDLSVPEDRGVQGFDRRFRWNPPAPLTPFLPGDKTSGPFRVLPASSRSSRAPLIFDSAIPPAGTPRAALGHSRPTSGAEHRRDAAARRVKISPFPKIQRACGRTPPLRPAEGSQGGMAGRRGDRSKLLSRLRLRSFAVRTDTRLGGFYVMWSKYTLACRNGRGSAADTSRNGTKPPGFRSIPGAPPSIL